MASAAAAIRPMTRKILRGRRVGVSAETLSGLEPGVSAETFSGALGVSGAARSDPLGVSAETSLGPNWATSGSASPARIPPGTPESVVPDEDVTGHRHEEHGQ